MDIMLALVTGGRTYANKIFVFRILDRLAANPDFDYLQVVQGGATGADALAGEWCEARRIDCLILPADWKRWGRAAGSIRNTQMLDLGPPDFVIAFPGGPGTADMIRQSRSRDIRVVVVADQGESHTDVEVGL